MGCLLALAVKAAHNASSIFLSLRSRVTEVTQMTEISLVEKSASFATLAFLPANVSHTAPLCRRFTQAARKHSQKELRRTMRHKTASVRPHKETAPKQGFPPKPSNSGFGGKRTSDGVAELCRLRRSEKYEVREDEVTSFAFVVRNRGDCPVPPTSAVAG